MTITHMLYLSGFSFFSGRSPLHMAVVKGSQSVLKCLLERKADPNFKDIAGGLLLGFPSIARLLLRH